MSRSFVSIAKKLWRNAPPMHKADKIIVVASLLCALLLVSGMGYMMFFLPDDPGEIDGHGSIFTVSPLPPTIVNK